MENLKNWLNEKEAELLKIYKFNGAGTVTLETGEVFSTNGALADLEQYLDENKIKFTTYLN